MRFLRLNDGFLKRAPLNIYAFRVGSAAIYLRAHMGALWGAIMGRAKGAHSRGLVG